MEFTIENGIPMPPRSHGRSPKYPFDKLHIGGSFAIKYSDAVDANKIKSRVANSARSFRKLNPGFKVELRIMPDDNVVRCWRVNDAA